MNMPLQMLSVDCSDQSSRIKVAERLRQLENSSLFEDCRSVTGGARSSRTPDSLLTIPSGRLTKRSYNPVVTAFVDAITEVKDPATESAQCLWDLRRQSCIESLYSARHLKYVSEFFLFLPKLSPMQYAGVRL